MGADLSKKRKKPLDKKKLFKFVVLILDMSSVLKQMTQKLELADTVGETIVRLRRVWDRVST